MKKVLPYAWGVFIAAITGFATVLGIAMVFGYIDNRIMAIMDILAPGHTIIIFMPSDPEKFQVRFLSFAVTIWTFERWRQRQSQIQQKGGNKP